MKRRKKIGILFGGYSSEHDISLKSAYGIISHINQERYEPVLIGITREGRWFLYRGSYKRIEAGTWHLNPSCVPAVISPDREAAPCPRPSVWIRICPTGWPRQQG